MFLLHKYNIKVDHVVTWVQKHQQQTRYTHQNRVTTLSPKLKSIDRTPIFLKKEMMEKDCQFTTRAGALTGYQFPLV